MNWISLSTFLLFVAAAYGRCPSGWHQYLTNCFHLSRDKETMPNAEILCERIAKQYHGKGSLATVNDAGTDKFLMDLIDASNASSYFNGLNSLSEDGKWTWIRNGASATYINWASDQPNNRGGEELCALMNGAAIGQKFPGQGRKWTDDPCSSSFNYICEIPQLKVAGTGVVG
uniref:Putative C-type lectin 2 n=1 Tax=Pinctada fucata TaxID=50426 RepID=A0A194ALR3_PINFU